MKKILVILFILANYYGDVAAQPKTNFGVKFGLSLPNYSQITNSCTVVRVDYSIGVLGGIFLDFALYKKLEIETELYYNSKPSKSGIETLHSTNEDFNLHFLTYSAGIKFKFSNAKITPYLTAGPLVNLYLGYTVKDTLVPNYLLIQEYDNVRRLTMGLFFGVGCEFKKMLPFTFLAETRFTQDINYLLKDYQFDIKARTYTLDLRIGVMF